MKLCWFNDHRLGVVRDEQVYDVTAALKVLLPPIYPGQRGDLLIEHLAEVCREAASLVAVAEKISVNEARFLSPVAQPGKIIGVPVNYTKHIAEADSQRGTVFTQKLTGGIKEQGLFLKANSALVGAGEGVEISFPERRTDHELELGVIIGRTARNVSISNALNYVAGYSIALDMVVRGSEDRSFRKSIDTYAVLGPWLVTADEIADPGNLNFELSVNGKVRQSSNTKHMIINIAEQIAWGSSFYTLQPGDIIMSGTCEGVGQVVAGDVMHCRIDCIGEMKVAVR